MERRKKLPIASNFPKFQRKVKIEKLKVLVLGVDKTSNSFMKAEESEVKNVPISSTHHEDRFT